MDMVLLVIESEKNQSGRGHSAPIHCSRESKANVSTVLNKTQSYVPKKLHQELLNDV